MKMDPSSLWNESNPMIFLYIYNLFYEIYYGTTTRNTRDDPSVNPDRYFGPSSFELSSSVDST